jgi:hypothetical protein
MQGNGNGQGQEGRSTAAERHGLGFSTRDSSKYRHSQLISCPITETVYRLAHRRSSRR